MNNRRNVYWHPIDIVEVKIDPVPVNLDFSKKNYAIRGNFLRFMILCLLGVILWDCF